MDFFNTMTPKEASNLNPLVLAFVGDAVQSLFVREYLVHKHDHKAGELHKLASAHVNAHSQAQLAEKVFGMLTEEEQSVFLRGRNGKNNHKAKNQSLVDYQKATGIEAVLGYLYLTGNKQRIKVILENSL